MKKLTKEQIENLPDWMPIEGFPNYDVNCREGLVRKSRTLKMKKPYIGKHGYPIVGLYKDGKQYIKTVHRLVAMAAFRHYGISTDGLDVCHLDEERHNPRISNLALGTCKENMNFEKSKQRKSEAKRGEKNPNFGKPCSTETRKKMSDAQPKKAVGAYKNEVLVMKFESIHEAGRNGFCYCHISACCTGKLKTHKGYNWYYI